MNLISLFALLAIAIAKPAATESAAHRALAQYNVINGLFNYFLNTSNAQATIDANYTQMLQFFDENVIFRYFDQATWVGYVDISEWLITLILGVSKGPERFTGNFAFRQYMSDGYIVWIAVDNEQANPLGPANVSNLTEYAAIQFNDQGKIQYVDATSDGEGHSITLGLNFSDPSYRTSTAAGICTFAMGSQDGTTKGSCSTANTGYADYNDCYAYLTSIPVGLIGVGRENNLVCRSNWIFTLATRPDYNCPSVGRTGGKRCNNSFTPTYLHSTEYPFDYNTFRGAPIGTGDTQPDEGTATAASITLPAGSAAGSAAADTTSAGQTAMIAGITASVVALVGVAIGVALTLVVQQRRKKHDAARKPLVEGDTSRVIIVENGMAREQDVKLFAGTQIPC